VFFLAMARKECDLLSLVVSLFFVAAAFDSLDPTGNITIKWDVMSWTGDGYEVCLLASFLLPIVVVEFLFLAQKAIHSLLDSGWVT
jgi:hypothetical protein